jgi:hypothetical protein
MRATRLVLCLMLLPLFVLSCRESTRLNAPAGTPTGPSISPTSQQATAGATATLPKATLPSTPVASATPTEYCDLVCEDATATAKITPGIPQPPSEEYQEQEKKYLELLTRVAAYTRTPTPTRTLTPTLIPAGRPGYVIYEGIGYDGPRNGRGTYRITYSLAQWRVERDAAQGDVLKQLRILDCTLDLKAEGRQVTPPLVRDTLTLGKVVWSRISVPKDAIIAYGLDTDQGYYLLELVLPKEAAATQIQQCQAAAEEVIATFDLIESP